MISEKDLPQKCGTIYLIKYRFLLFLKFGGYSPRMRALSSAPYILVFRYELGVARSIAIDIAIPLSLFFSRPPPFQLRLVLSFFLSYILTHMHTVYNELQETTNRNLLPMPRSSARRLDKKTRNVSIATDKRIKSTASAQPFTSRQWFPLKAPSTVSTNRDMNRRCATGRY